MARPLLKELLFIFLAYLNLHIQHVIFVGRLFTFTVNLMVLVPEIGKHVTSNRWYLICSRHLIGSREVKIGIFFLPRIDLVSFIRAQRLPSNICTMDFLRFLQIPFTSSEKDSSIKFLRPLGGLKLKLKFSNIV